MDRLVSPTISKFPADILKTWGVNSTCVNCHTGVDLVLRDGEVLSCCAGVVTSVGMDYTSHMCVSVEYDADTLIRYMHLQTAAVVLGQAIRGGDRIGIHQSYVHVELCQVDPSRVGKYQFPVRVGARTYDKFDPMKILSGVTKLYQGDEQDVASS